MTIGQSITRAVSKQALTLRKSSPTIAFAAGIVGVLGGTYLACRATLKLEAKLDEIEQDIDDVRARGDRLDSDYTEAEHRADMAYAYGRSATKLIKLYAPAVGVGVVSIALLTGSHVALKRRNTALMMAYAALEAAYAKYREEVESRFGPQIQAELEARRDRIDDVLAEEENNAVALSLGCSPYARFFDETSFSFEKNAEINRIFIEATQAWANNRLQASGYLFLNDVYRQLGLEESGAGQVVGWVFGEGMNNYVDFGLFTPRNSRFINLQENACILDFNIDGIVFDKIAPSRRSRLFAARRYLDGRY